MRTAIIWSIFGFFLLSQAFWIFSLGTLGLPSLFHPSDTFMDLYNTAFFSQHNSDPYLDWKSIYSPLSFLLLNHVSFIDCTVQYILGEATVRVDYSILNQYCQVVSSSVELRTSSIVINTAFLLVHIITIYQLFKLYSEYGFTNGTKAILVFSAPLFFLFLRGNLLILVLLSLTFWMRAHGLRHTNPNDSKSKQKSAVNDLRYRGFVVFWCICLKSYLAPLLILFSKSKRDFFVMASFSAAGFFALSALYHAGLNSNFSTSILIENLLNFGGSTNEFRFFERATASTNIFVYPSLLDKVSQFSLNEGLLGFERAAWLSKVLYFVSLLSHQIFVITAGICLFLIFFGKIKLCTGENVPNFILLFFLWLTVFFPASGAYTAALLLPFAPVVWQKLPASCINCLIICVLPLDFSVVFATGSSFTTAFWTGVETVARYDFSLMSLVRPVLYFFIFYKLMRLCLPKSACSIKGELTSLQ